MGFKPIRCFRGVNKIPGAHIEALMLQRMLQISASYFYIVFSMIAPLLITTISNANIDKIPRGLLGSQGKRFVNIANM